MAGEGYPSSPVLTAAQILAALATVAGAFGYNVLVKPTISAGSLIYGAAANGVSELAIGGANTVLTSSGAAPQWSTSLNLAGTLAVTGATNLKGMLSLSAAGTAPAALLHLVNEPLSAGFWGQAGILLRIGGSNLTDTSSSGSVGGIAASVIGAPTFGCSNAGVTYAEATTLFIGGPPSQGTNVPTFTTSYAVNVSSGAVRLGGTIAATTTATGTLILNGANAGIGCAGAVFASQFNAGGGAASGNNVILVNGNPLTGGNQFGVGVNMVATSAATIEVNGFRSNVSPANSAFTIPRIATFRGNTVGGSAGATMTNVHGFYQGTNSAGVTSNCGYYYGAGDPVAGTWGFYNDAATKNYLGTAATLVNTTTDDTLNKLQVAGGILGNAGTITTSLPGIKITQTWNAAVTFTAALVNVTATSSNAGSLLLDLQIGGASRFNWAKEGVYTLAASDATTNTITDIIVAGHNSTGSPAAGFGSGERWNLKSDTTNDRNAARFSVEWATSTDASRKARAKLWATDTADRECIRIEASGTAAMVGFLGASAVVQQALTVDPVTVLVNFGFMATGGGLVKTWRKVITGINVNSAATDVGTFTNLPAKYRVIRLEAFDASTSLTTATVDLRTATAGGGTALVAAAGMAACTAATKFSDLTLAAIATTDYQTATTLTVRNVTAQGGAATVSFLLEVIDLT